MEVYLIRHTTPKIEKGICYGQSDIPLKKEYQKEFAKVKDQLPLDLDIIYSSPLSRCRLLMNAITCPKKIIDPRLKEMNFGDWELKKWDDIDQQKLHEWMEDYINIGPPQGESLREIQSRVSDFWKDLNTTTFSKVGVITHGGVIRIIKGSD